MYGTITGPLAYWWLINLISPYILGFVLGFYSSFLILTKAKIRPLVALVLSFLIGIIAGSFVSGAIYSLNDSHNKYWYFFTGHITYFVALELVLVLIHFFVFQKLDV